MHKMQSVSVQLSAAEQECRKNVNLSIEFNRWLLKPFGVWPSSGNNSRMKICLSVLVHSICYALIGAVFVPATVCLVLEVKETYNRIRMLGPLSFGVMIFMKYSLLIVHKDDIRDCIERIKLDWKNVDSLEDKKIMLVYANYGRRLASICIIFAYSTFILYYVAIPYSVGKIPAEDINSTYIPLPYPFAKIIVDFRQSPTNEIIFASQAMSGIVMHSVMAAVGSLAAIFAVHACGQMQVLMNWLEHLVDGRSDMGKTVDGRIAGIVNRHVQILGFLAITEKALQQISFVEFIGSTLNLCLLGYYTIMEWNPHELTFAITYTALLSSFTFNIFIFCYIGDLVSEQCKRVGEISYMIEWYRLSGNKKHCCILIIAMSNSSIKFTAGNMVELSINTFSDVVKTSVAFLNMLRAIT